MEEKLYDVVVSGTLYEDGWYFSIESIVEKRSEDFQEIVDRVAVDCPDYGLCVDLKNIEKGKCRLYFANTHGGSSTDMYGVRAKTGEEAEKIISALIG